MSDRDATGSPVIPPLRWFWLFVVWSCMAILMSLGPLNWLILPLMVFLLLNAWQTRTWRPVMALALSPLPLGFVGGMLSWGSEHPTTRGYGYMRSEFFNLDRERRLYHTSSGCVVYGGEMLRDLPWNCGLSCMTQLFGLPPRVHHGPYPTKEEARNLTDSAPPLSPDDFAQGKIKLTKDRVLDIGQPQARQIITDCGGLVDAVPGDPLLKIRAVEMVGGCIVLRLTERPDDGFFGTDAIYLIDAERLWPFARYILAGEGARHFPYFIHARASLQ